MLSTILTFGGFLFKGPLGRVLDTIDHKIDNETERTRIRGEAVEEYVKTSAETQRAKYQHKAFWLVWMMFSIPLGVWFGLICLDTAFTFIDWGIPDLPVSVQSKAELIFASIFGSGGTVAGLQAVSNAIRGRK